MRDDAPSDPHTATALPEDLPLGEATTYPRVYAPEVLRTVPRSLGRQALELAAGPLPFAGVDVWRAWELSWLDAQGKPAIGVAELEVPATSPKLVESKSLKLYLGSLFDRRFPSANAVAALLLRDLTVLVGARVGVRVIEPAAFAELAPAPLDGDSLDDLELDGPLLADVAPQLLDGAADPSRVVDAAHVTRLFRSRCPITGQPDWASVRVAYRGPAIDPRRLLRYLLSYREHGGFHEACVEQIFVDLRRRCAAEHLTVQACFTRRGGIDINPWRSTADVRVATPRPWRS